MKRIVLISGILALALGACGDPLSGGGGNWFSFDQKYMILAEGPDAPVQSASLSRTIEYF